MSENNSLAGRLLIAMPGMGDTRFAQAVVFVCAHSEDGAMGLIVNKPSRELKLGNLLEQLSITPGGDMPDLRVHFGGPVEHGRGFVLHGKGYHSAISTMDVDADFAITATLDILEDIAEGRGPEQAILALGYAGWGPGQLEAEIAANGWLTVSGDARLVFETPDMQKWEAALAKLGVSALALSADGGHA